MSNSRIRPLVSWIKIVSFLTLVNFLLIVLFHFLYVILVEKHFLVDNDQYYFGLLNIGSLLINEILIFSFFRRGSFSPKIADLLSISCLIFRFILFLIAYNWQFGLRFI